MVRRDWRAALLTITALGCGPCTANAADRAGLAELLRSGAEASSAKRWQVCVDAYSAAGALESTPRTWGELGLCEEQLGRFVAAHDHLFRAMESSPTGPVKEPWARYQAALARVKERVALVIVTTSPPSAKVVLDGRPLGAADGRAFAVEPGTHTIGARLAGHDDAVETRTMRARDTPSFHLQLEARSTPSSSAIASTAPTTISIPASAAPRPSLGSMFVPAASPRGFLVAMTYLGAGVALVGAGTWIGLEVERASLRGRVDRTACGPAAVSRPEVCDVLGERRQQRDQAGMFTIGAVVTTTVVAMSTALAIRLEWGATHAAVVPVADSRGGGVAVGGVW